MGGANTYSAPGIYGNLGEAAPGNAPGAREGATGWTDVLGKFWLFGSGYGRDSTGTLLYLNDMWQYQP
jgi:hypothetical protein